LDGDSVLSLGQTFVEPICMKMIIAIFLWFILFVLCWPLAIALIFILPIIWLILLPFRIIGFTIEAVFKLIGTILTLPFRLVKAL
jgi:hypothetical protein